MFKKLIWIFIILNTVHIGYADNPITSLGIFGQDISARPVSIGNSYICLADDANTLIHNPAGLTYLTIPELTFSRFEDILDTNRNFIGYAHQFTEFGAGISFANYDGGKVSDGTRELSAETDYLFGLSAAKEIKQNLSLGVTGKFILTKLIEQYFATALAVDAGLIYKLFNKKVSVGIACYNIGTPITYGGIVEDLPFSIKTGCAVKVYDTIENSVTIGTGLEWCNGYKTISSDFGGEYLWNKLFALRINYKLYPVRTFIIGMGFIWKGLQFDYGWSNYEQVENLHLVSFSVKFYENYYKSGMKYYTKSMYSQAIQQLEKMLATHPNYANAQEIIQLCKLKLLDQSTFKEVKVASAPVSVPAPTPEPEIKPVIETVPKEKYVIEIKTMLEIPTTVYYLFREKDISVINVKITNNTKSTGTFKIDYRIETKTRFETKNDIFIAPNMTEEINLIPSLDQDVIEFIDRPEPVFIYISVNRMTPTGEPVQLLQDAIKTKIYPTTSLFPTVYDAKGQPHNFE